MAKRSERTNSVGANAPRRKRAAATAGAERPDLRNPCPRMGVGSLQTWDLNALSLSPALAVEGNVLPSSVSPPGSVWFTAATTSTVANDHGILANLDPETMIIRTWDLDTRLGPLTGIGANYLQQSAGGLWVSASAAVVHRLAPAARAQLTWSLPVDPIHAIIRGIRALPDDALAVSLQNTAGPGAVLLLNPATDVLRRFQLPVEDAPSGAALQDGHLFFCEFSTRRIARLDPTRAADNLTEWQLPARFGNPVDLTVAADGRVWFTDKARVGRLDPARDRLAVFAKEGVVPQALAALDGAGRPERLAIADGNASIDVLCATRAREVSVPVAVSTVEASGTYVTPAPARPTLRAVRSEPASTLVPPVDPAEVDRYGVATPTLAVAGSHGALYATGVDYLTSTFRFYRLSVSELHD